MRGSLFCHGRLIGIDHVARVTTTAGATRLSEVTMQLGGQFGALQMLARRVALIRDYLAAVQTGPCLTESTSAEGHCVALNGL